MLRARLWYLAAVTLCVSGVASAQRVFYVDDSATAVPNGLSWATAFPALQTALAAANQVGDEIRVGQGVYRPGQAGGSRTSSFVMRSGLTIRGGYAGFGAANPDQRSPFIFESFLSGDLNGDDLPGFVNTSDNSYHVVTVSNADTTCEVDGFVIVGGNANGAGDQLLGGGAYGSPTSARFTACLFLGNVSQAGSGGYHGLTNSVAFGAPRLTRCLFIGNVSTGSYGGGARFTCMASGRPAMQLLNCSFSENEAATFAGGFAAVNVDLLMLNCLFADNIADGGAAGGLRVTNSTGSMVNCTVANNHAVVAGGLAGGVLFEGSFTPTLVNCVLWGNDGAQIAGAPVGTVTYSTIQGGYAGTGNLSTNPLYENAAGMNYRLGAGSPAVDSGNTTAYFTAAAPYGIVSDVGYGARFLDDPAVLNLGVGDAPMIDRGCYERAPGFIDPCPVDTNGDGVINFADLNNLLSFYGSTCR